MSGLAAAVPLADMWLDGWGTLVGIAWTLFWVLLIVAIVGLIAGHRRGGGTGGSSSALRILEERYARGEIDQAEFNARRAVLRGDPADAPTQTVDVDSPR